MKQTALIILSVLSLIACNNKTKEKEMTEQKEKIELPYTKFAVIEDDYGEIDGKKITQYTLTNPKGMAVKILNYGGTVTDILVPDRDGKMGDVVLGYDSLSGYLQEG